jgi:hypothetical protein
VNDREAAEAVRDWVVAVAADDGSLPDIANTYTAPMETRQAAPPNIIAITRRVALVDADQRFPLLGLQQTRLRLFEMEGSVMLDNAETEEAVQGVHNQLMAYGAALRESNEADSTLKGNLPDGVQAAPYGVFEYLELPQEYEGGTIGRLVAFQITLGEAT